MTDSESRADDVRWPLMHLKKKGVDDPNIDLLLALQGVEAALEAGADKDITAERVLGTYEADLEDFDLSDALDYSTAEFVERSEHRIAWMKRSGRLIKEMAEGTDAGDARGED